MEQLQFLDGLDTGRALSFPHRWKHYPKKESIAAFGRYWGDEGRSGHLHQYLHDAKTLKAPLNSDTIKFDVYASDSYVRLMYVRVFGVVPIILLD